MKICSPPKTFFSFFWRSLASFRSPLRVTKLSDVMNGAGGVPLTKNGLGGLDGLRGRRCRHRYSRASRSEAHTSLLLGDAFRRSTTVALSRKTNLRDKNLGSASPRAEGCGRGVAGCRRRSRLVAVSVASGSADAAAAFDASDKAPRADDRVQTLQMFFVELGLIAMGIVDTLMVGHLGESALAAASLGGVTTCLVLVTMMGLVGALDPLTSQAFGAGDSTAIKQHLRSGMRASLFLAAGGMLTMLGAGPLFALCGQPLEHAAAAAAYCRVEAWGMLPTVLFQTFRLSLMGMFRDLDTFYPCTSLVFPLLPVSLPLAL